MYSWQGMLPALSFINHTGRGLSAVWVLREGLWQPMVHVEAWCALYTFPHDLT